MAGRKKSSTLVWLAKPEEPAAKQSASLDALDERLLSCALEPHDAQWVSGVHLGLESGELHREWSARRGIDPEFCGDSILNNTCIVLWVEAPGSIAALPIAAHSRSGKLRTKSLFSADRQTD